MRLSGEAWKPLGCGDGADVAITRTSGGQEDILWSAEFGTSARPERSALFDLGGLDVAPGDAIAFRAARAGQTPTCDKIYLNPTLVYEPGSSDTDGDQFPDAHEEAIGADPLDRCAHYSGDSSWPPDVNNDGPVSGGDIAPVVSNFGRTPSHPQWNKRFDIKDPTSAQRAISGGDIGLAVLNFGVVCGE